MAVQKQYKMEWTRHGDVKCILTITDVSESSWVSTTIIPLTPGAEPFRTRENADTNPLTPMRSQTGTLSFVYTGEFDIELKSSHQWRVELKEVDGTSRDVVFLGWLKAETFDQSLWGVNEDVSFNVIDDIEALKTWNLDEAAGFGMTSLRSIICECLIHINTHGQGVSFSNEYRARQEDKNIFSLLDLQVSRYAFFKAKDEDDTTDGKEYEGESCYDVVEKICKTFGWSLRTFGTSIIFTYPGATKYTTPIPIQMLIVDDILNLQNFITPTELTSSALDVCGTHTFSIEQGYKRISIKSNLNKVGDVIPSIDEKDFEYVKDHTYGDNNYKLYTLFYRPKNKRIALHNIHCNETGQLTTEGTELTPYDVESTKIQNASISKIVKYDKYKQSDVDNGDKYNYNFSLGILVYPNYPEKYNEFGLMFTTHPTYDSAQTCPAIVLKAQGVATYNNGAFCISANLIDGINEAIRVMFRVGNQYWNGTAWTTAKSFFDIEITDAHDKIKNTKTISQMFKADGYVMPINNKTLYGDAELQILHPCGTNTQTCKTRVDYGNDSPYILSNLKVEYCEPYDYIQGESKDSHTYSHTNDGWTDDYNDVDLDIYSDNNDGASYGVLTRSGYGPVDYLYSTNYIRPELALLEKYRSHFSRSRKLYKLKSYNSTSLFDKNYITINGTRFAILARTDMNWYNNEAEFLLESLS